MTSSKDERYDLNVKKKRGEKLEISFCFPKLSRKTLKMTVISHCVSSFS